MSSQIKLGHIFGIEIGLHYSWFFIALLIVFSLFQQFHAANQEWGDGLILTLSIVTGVWFFVSLLLHELAHSLFAKSHGLPVREITLFALGGVSQIEKSPSALELSSGWRFVGPLSSACIGLVCFGLRTMAGQATGPAYVMLSWLGYINLALAGFNMIPGYPLDGGRILRAAIWWKTGDAERSTRRQRESGRPSEGPSLRSELCGSSEVPASGACGPHSSDGSFCRLRARAISKSVLRRRSRAQPSKRS